MICLQEYVTVARPVDFHEKVYEVPSQRHIQTFVPKIQVREVTKTIPKPEPDYIERRMEIPHTKIVDKYVEVPVKSGTEVKYVPRVEVRERTVKVSKPEIKWVEKVIEVPQVKEVVRYIESDTNVEQVIRYVPKGEADVSPTELAEQYLQEPCPLNTPRSTQPLSGPCKVTKTCRTLTYNIFTFTFFR